MKAARSCLIASVVVMTATAAAAGRLERETEARWKGAWVLVATELDGSCPPGPLALEAWTAPLPSRALVVREGELARVTHVDVDRARVQLVLALPEPVLTSFEDGPFTLEEHRRCTVAFDVPVSRTVVKSKDADGIDEHLSRWMTRHRSRGAAEAAPAFRPRPFEAVPDQVELLAEHAAWKREQRSLAIRDRARDELAVASRLMGRVDEHPDYADGLAAGIEHANREARSRGAALGCDAILRAPVGRVGRRSDHGGSHSDDYHEGFDDGWDLAWSVLAAEALMRCDDQS